MDRTWRRLGTHPAKTRRYLPHVPGRLEFVSAPRHGSWPDLTGGLFSRTARRTPHGIRVSSRDELKERILRYLEEASAEPVVHGRRRDLSNIDPMTEGLVVDTLLSDGTDKAG